MYLGPRGNLELRREQAEYVLPDVDAAIVSRRPDTLSDQERAHRNRLLAWVNGRGLWLKCECCPASTKTWLYTRRTKEGYTVVRHSSNFEHAPDCPIRTWRSSGVSVPPESPETLIQDLMEMTRIGRIQAGDGDVARVTQQFRSIRHYGRQPKFQTEGVRFLTHPDELNRLPRVLSATQTVWAILLAAAVDHQGVILPTGHRIQVPVDIPSHVLRPEAGPWLIAILYDCQGGPRSACAYPVLSASNLTPIATPIERSAVATLRHCLRYWQEQFGIQVVAQRALRNGRPSWCLAKVAEDGQEMWLADVVIATGSDWEQLRKQYGQRCLFLPESAQDTKLEMSRLRRVMTRLVLDGCAEKATVA